MFMRFRGGGIGHKATRNWDDILQHEEHGAEEEEEGDLLEEIADGVLDADTEEEEWEGIEDDNGDSESDEEEGDNEDRIIADEGEELDDDVLAEEGYGAL
jgi:hypothetical protein